MTVQVGLCRTWSETTLFVSPRGGSILNVDKINEKLKVRKNRRYTGFYTIKFKSGKGNNGKERTKAESDAYPKTTEVRKIISYHKIILKSTQ